MLIVEDEPVIAADLKASLTRFGYQVVGIFDNGEEAVEAIPTLKPTLVLLDIMLAGNMDGIMTAKKIAQVCDIPVVFMTSHGDKKTLCRAGESAPYGYVLKPFEPQALQATLEVALHRAQSELSHRKVERWLLTTLRSLADAVIASDRHGRITFLNPSAELLTGWKQPEALGRNFSEVFVARHEVTGEPVSNAMNAVAGGGDTTFLGDEIVLRSKSGKEAYIEQTIAPVRSCDSGVIGTVVVFRDCTVRRKAEREMRRVQTELKKANETLLHKHEELQGFYHTVSHELKTPLTAAREFVSLVLEGLAGPVNETQIDYLKTAQESCDQMRIYINDLLDSTRLDTGKMSLEVKEADPKRLISHVVETLKPAATRKQLTVLSKVAEDLPLFAFDEQRLMQVLTNLLTNAIKFTPEGGRITISAAYLKETNGSVEITVSDTGCGIPPSHIGRIFDRLYQVRGEDVSQGKGLGLGLHICKELVQLHGGTITVESTPNQGSTFRVSLPTKSRKQARILVVDSDASSRTILCSSLAQADYSVVGVSNGYEAMDRIGDTPFDAALMSLSVAEMDGPETLERFLAQIPKLPLIIHSACPDSELMTRALRSSPLTVLVKPCTASHLLATVAKVVEGSQVAA